MASEGWGLGCLIELGTAASSEHDLLSIPHLPGLAIRLEGSLLAG